MIYALVDRTRVRSSPDAKASCPICEAPVVPKCGQIKVWHWAHRPRDPCIDTWAEESDWHLAWKDWALAQGWEIEVVIEKNGAKHRADILTPSGWVIELQHSGLDVREIHEREVFYGRVVWIWDVAAARKRFVIREKPQGWVGLRWKQPRWSLCEIHRPIYLDLGEHTLLECNLNRKTTTEHIGDFQFPGRDVCLGRGRWRERSYLVSAFGTTRP